MKILLASNNTKKRLELERALIGRDFQVLTPADLSLELDPDETGSTFEENALIKAMAFARVFDGLVLADDSGLEVDALGGRPGVHSARYASEDSDDARNRAHLIAQLAAVDASNRTARFVCVLVLARGSEVLATVRGTCEGRIVEAERGHAGFGYDPLFLHESSQKTFAELEPEEKDSLSHRGAALRKLVTHLNHIVD